MITIWNSSSHETYFFPVDIHETKLTKRIVGEWNHPYLVLLSTMQTAKSHGDSLKVTKPVDLGLLNLIISKSASFYLT